MATLNLDEHELLLVQGGLVDGYKEALQTLELLRITRTRQLNEREWRMLPVLLREIPREELPEHVDAWITYVMYYESTLDAVEKALREERGEEDDK